MFFFPPRKLTARAVKLAVGRQDPELSALARGSGYEADEQLMGVRSEDDRVGLGAADLGRDLGLRPRPDFAPPLVPLAIGQPRCVLPRLHVAVKARVRPEVMAVGREMQPHGIGAQAPAE